MKDDAQRIVDVVSELVPYKTREFKLRQSKEFHGDGDAMYSFIVNEWIFKQPDKALLMELFILLGFNMLAFVELLVTGDLTVTAKKYGFNS